MNKFLKSIEDEGSKYGLKLNKTKCEALYTGAQSNIRFADGTPIKTKESATYLGCNIHQEGNIPRELSQRIAA